MIRSITKLQRVAIVALIVQVALAAWLWMRGDDHAPASAQRLLPTLDAAAIARIEITAPGAPPLVLARAGAQAAWTLASSYAYPAQPSKVSALVGELARAAAGAPIAEQASRHVQLGVDAAAARRTIVATTADGTAFTLRLGVAIDSQHSAARVGDDARVYAVRELAADRVGVEPREWIEPHYVPFARDDLAKIAIEHPGSDAAVIELVRNPKATDAGSGSGSGSGSDAANDEPPWLVTIAGAPIALAAGERLDAVALTKVLAEATTMTVAAPAPAATRSVPPAATVTLTPRTGAPVVIDIVADPEAYWVRARGATYAARVETARLDALVHADRATLVTTK